MLIWSAWLFGPFVTILAASAGILGIAVEGYVSAGECMFVVGAALMMVVACKSSRRVAEFWMLVGYWVLLVVAMIMGRAGLPSVVPVTAALALAVMLPLVVMVRGAMRRLGK